jgi:hypothetical protein
MSYFAAHDAYIALGLFTRIQVGGALENTKGGPLFEYLWFIERGKTGPFFGIKWVPSTLLKTFSNI